MKHKTRSKILILMGLVLILGAAGLTVYNFHTSEQAGDTAAAALQVLRGEIPEVQPLEETQTPAVEELPGVSLGVSAVEIPDYLLNPNMDMPEKTIDGIRYIGYVEIPALELVLPVITEESAALLKMAPCRYSGSAYLDDLVIAGHNYTQHFGNIHQLSYGDTVRFVDTDGNVFSYEVADMESIPANGVNAMLDGDWDLTLFTCNVSKSSRITVRCVRTDK